MSQKTLAQRFLSSLVDTLHHWSGIMLDKQELAPKVEPIPASPQPQPPTVGAIMMKQVMVAFTLLLDPPLAEELSKLAQVMQVTESDLLIRLVKIAKMIREFGLYGVPTPEGNHLGIYIQKTGAVQTISIECPAQKDHHPPPAPAPAAGKPPSALN